MVDDVTLYVLGVTGWLMLLLVGYGVVWMAERLWAWLARKI